MSKLMKKPRILVASSSQEVVASLRQILPRAEYSDLLYAKSLSMVQNRVVLGGIDILILIPPLTDECSIDSMQHLAMRNDMGVLVIVKQDISEQVVYQLRSTGIAVLTRPINEREFRQTISLLLSMLTRLQLIENENARLRKQLNSMRIINQAKYLLIKQKQISEEAAHHYVETYSMEHCITKQQAAEEIIALYQY